MQCVRCKHELPARADRCVRCFALNPQNSPQLPWHAPAPVTMSLESDPPKGPLSVSFDDERDGRTPAKIAPDAAVTEPAPPLPKAAPVLPFVTQPDPPRTFDSGVIRAPRKASAARSARLPAVEQFEFPNLHATPAAVHTDEFALPRAAAASEPAQPAQDDDFEIAFDATSLAPAAQPKAAPQPKAAAKIDAPRPFAAPSALRRAGAFLIDAASLTSVTAGFIALSAAVIGPARLAPHGIGSRDYWLDLLFSAHLPLLWAALALCLGAAYSALFAMLGGRTPGLLFFDLRLVSLSGGTLSPRDAFKRALWAIPGAALGLFGFTLALFDARGQTLHDKLGRSIVIADAGPC